MLGCVGSLMMLLAFLRHRFVWISWMGVNTVLGRLHHQLEGLAVVDEGIPIPGSDATGQDALDGAAVVFGEDPGQPKGCWIESPR